MLPGGLQERLCRFSVRIISAICLCCLHKLAYLYVLIAINSTQIAVRAGGFSAIIVVGMAVLGVAILYATFYVILGVDTPGSMKVTDCKHLL